MSNLKVDAMESRTAGGTVAVSATSGNITTLTSSASITIDLSDSNNFKVTLGHNATFNNPSNIESWHLVEAVNMKTLLPSACI